MLKPWISRAQTGDFKVRAPRLPAIGFPLALGTKNMETIEDFACWIRIVITQQRFVLARVLRFLVYS